MFAIVILNATYFVDEGTATEIRGAIETDEPIIEVPLDIIGEGPRPVLLAPCHVAMISEVEDLALTREAPAVVSFDAARETRQQ